MKQNKLLTTLFFSLLVTNNLYSENLLFEDSFENGTLKDWSINNTESKIKKMDSPEGSFCLELASGGKVYKEIKLKPNSKYKIKAYLKTHVGAEEIQLNIDGLKYNNISVASALTKWTLIEEFFQTSAKQETAILEFYHPLSFADNSAWVDNVKIEYIGEAEDEKRKGLTMPMKRNAKEDLGIVQQEDDKMQWFLDSKYGLFIHWGLYAGPAQGEWYMRNKSISIDDYRKLAYKESGDSYFSAESFDAAEWADLAKRSGMKYMTLTTQHHDGYALFKSDYPDAFTSYQTHNRDFVKEYVDACRNAGLYVGLYKTLINWRYPGYYDVTGTDCKNNSWGYITNADHKENARRMKEELYCMTKELLSNYGKIDYIFWDGAWLAEQGSDAEGSYFWESGKYIDKNNDWPINNNYTLKDNNSDNYLGLMGMVRELQPDIIVNPRTGWRGDISCEEGGAKISGPIRSGEIYEKCLSLHYSWGYTPLAENAEKIVNADRVKRYLADCLMRNMSLMVNVGPDRFGRIPEAEANVLLEVGKWINNIEEAVYGTRGGPWNPLDEYYGFSYKDNKIFVYLLEDYKESDFILPSTDKLKVRKVYNVADKKELKFSNNKNGETVIKNIPTLESGVVRVIAIEFNKDILASMKSK